MECLRLRVKDLDFSYEQLTVRDGKGEKDRITMLPAKLKQPLVRHLQKVKLIHGEDLDRRLRRGLPALCAGAKVSDGSERVGLAVRLSSRQSLN
jgi:integrase